MKWNVEPYRETLLDYTRRLLAQDSPTGFTEQAVALTEEMVHALGYEAHRGNRGHLIVEVPGRDHSKKVGLSAHLDTLGLMVRSITADGQLMISKVGGVILPTLDGEYCRIYTRKGKVYTGTILSLSPASHCYDDAHTRPRDDKNMAVRIDEAVRSRADVEALGISCGDFITYEPKYTETPAGFVKSRFLDDKVGVACLLTALKILKDLGQKPRYDTQVIFTVYEEVLHGASMIPTDLSELVAVDMGCVAPDLNGTEQTVCICAKDASGPYDHELVSRLITLAEDNGLPFAVDVYSNYSSDVSAALRGGRDVKGTVMGPGVHASHGMERTHWDSLRATVQLAGLYLDAE